MKEGSKFIQQRIRRIQSDVEAFPRVPIVELAGDCRVLIEYHLGILTYDTECITIKLRYGKLKVCGIDLTMAQMTKEQLVIHGTIHSISIIRGEN